MFTLYVLPFNIVALNSLNFFLFKRQFGKRSVNLLWKGNRRVERTGIKEEVEWIHLREVWFDCFNCTTILLLMYKDNSSLKRNSSKSQLWNLPVGKSDTYWYAYICFPITSRIPLITRLTFSVFISSIFVFSYCSIHQIRQRINALTCTQKIINTDFMLVYYQHHYLKSVLYLQIACINIYYLQHFHLEF